MSERFEDYVYINKKYLSFLGLWPLFEEGTSWRSHINKFHAVINIALLIIFLLPPMLLDLYMVWGDINATVQNLCLTVHGIFVTLKFVHVVSNKDIFKELLSLMKRNFDSALSASTGEYQKIILLDHANFARTVTKYFLVSVYYFETLLFLIPFIYGINSDPVRHKRYPYCSWYYFDQNSNLIYAICYGIQVFSGVLLGVSFLAGMDSFIFVAIWHSCAQLTILQRKLLSIGDGSKFSLDEMQEVIQMHNEQISSKILSLFLKPLSLILQGFDRTMMGLASSLLFVFRKLFKFEEYLYNESLNSGESDFRGTVLYSGYLVVNLFQILLYCWPSNELMEKSFEVGNAAYQSLWTNLNQKSSRAIILMILRAQSPLVIIAGGFYEMTLENFTKIVKVSMTFLSVLRAMLSSQEIN